MSFEIPGPGFTLEAAADLSANQYRFVVVDGNGRAALAGAGAAAVGVLQNKPDALGKAATIVERGISKVAAGAAVAAGALVAADATGRAVVATAAHTDTSDAGVAQDPLIGSHVLGIALEAAAGAGEIIAVKLAAMGAVPTTAV